ncbi:Universal stress protein F [Roseovarius albus]|uniref:Universal stress protein n=1 Tax=Roseovarius albus TaxID=1247867 RepID=A0A1X6YPQ6_9RHOB|nr:universal stress protein [Roseovarius albus]SLN25760.1 Universal stress protein F [Roseovarius albus]
MSIKTILCAIDVSSNDRDAKVLKQAARMAEVEGAKLDVITVLPDFGMSLVGSFFDSEFHEKAVEHAHDALQDAVSEALGADTNENIRHIVATGNTYEEILKLAEASEADLIVVGAHKPDLAEKVLGPNSARVARYAKVSVMIVRD